MVKTAAVLALVATAAMASPSAQDMQGYVPNIGSFSPEDAFSFAVCCDESNLQVPYGCIAPPTITTAGVISLAACPAIQSRLWECTYDDGKAFACSDPTTSTDVINAILAIVDCISSGLTTLLGSS